ncbi:MAG: hypothetical protein IPQ25_16030 [Chitinophagaceae bacterium]|nr:hypothetical protein [Chitinophagaceae bacterium]
MSTAITGVKPHLSFWQIWNMCFGFFGIQFGWSLQMGNMSAIYEFLGAAPDEIPLFGWQPYDRIIDSTYCWLYK